MSEIDDFQYLVRWNLRRIALCQEVLEEVKESLVNPLFPEEKADILIATENLAETSFDILLAVREMAWGADPDNPFNK